LQEILDRRQVEENLREKEEKYRNLFEYSNDCIFLHDLDGNIIDINKKLRGPFETAIPNPYDVSR